MANENNFNFDDVDMELFILEIKNHPEIWNIAGESYHDRTKKRGAWIEICRVFCEGFDEKDERHKNEICTTFINKWRSIKDNFKKSLSKKTKSGQAADSGRRYIYARQLSFLQTAGATTLTESSLGNDNIEDQSEEQSGQNSIQQEGPKESPRYNQRSIKKQKRDIEASLIDFMNTPIPTPTAPAIPEPNPDRSFFESILPSISNFTEDQKLDFRCEILNIIKWMRQRPLNIPLYQNIPQPHNQFIQTSAQLSSQQYAQLQTIQTRHFSTRLPQISPSTSGSTAMDNQMMYSEENSIDLFRDEA